MGSDADKIAAELAQENGEETADGRERRRHPRFEFGIPSIVRVLLEEETFTPFRFPGRTRNLSATGLLVEIDGMDEKLYDLLKQRERMIRIHLSVPESGGEIVFLGTAVHYDYRRTNYGGTCVMGVRFQSMQELEDGALAFLLKRLQVRILIATDQTDLREDLERKLEVDGHKVFPAADGVKAWELVRSQAPDIVFCTRSLPRIDGLQLCQNIKSDHELRRMYFVLLTSNGDEEEKEEAAAQVDATLSMPVDDVKLAARLKVALGFAEYQRSLEAVALKDPLTDLPNRRAFEAALKRETARARRHATPLQLMIMDVDRFKEINDRFGHDQGDTVLRMVARSIVDVIGHRESAFRIGGDEFAILLSEPEEKARFVASTLQKLYGGQEGARQIDPNYPMISLGLASYAVSETPEELFRHADAAMYENKKRHNGDISTVLAERSNQTAAGEQQDPIDEIP